MTRRYKKRRKSLKRSREVTTRSVQKKEKKAVPEAKHYPPGSKRVGWGGASEGDGRVANGKKEKKSHNSGKNLIPGEHRT